MKEIIQHSLFLLALERSSAVLNRAGGASAKANRGLLRPVAASQRPLRKSEQTGAVIANGEEILSFIFDEFQKNASDDNETFKAIRQKLKFPEVWMPDYGAVVAGKMFEAMMLFKDKVGYGKAWDQKRYIVSKWGKLSRLYGVLVDYDVWSNIHYGYVGSLAGFSNDVLLDCAGIAQAVYSDVPEAGSKGS